MTYELVGKMTLGACLPIGAAAQASIDAAVGVTLPEIQARIAGIIALQAQISISPPTIAAQIEALMAAVANLQVGMPTIAVDLAAMAAALAELQATLGSLQAQIAFSISLGLLLGTPGLYAYTYSGQAGGLIPGGLPDGTPTPTTAPVNAVILIATDGGSWSALQSCFATGGA